MGNQCCKNTLDKIKCSKSLRTKNNFSNNQANQPIIPETPWPGDHFDRIPAQEALHLEQQGSGFFNNSNNIKHTHDNSKSDNTDHCSGSWKHQSVGGTSFFYLHENENEQNNDQCTEDFFISDDFHFKHHENRNSESQEYRKRIDDAGEDYVHAARMTNTPFKSSLLSNASRTDVPSSSVLSTCNYSQYNQALFDMSEPPSPPPLPPVFQSSFSSFPSSSSRSSSPPLILAKQRVSQKSINPSSPYEVIHPILPNEIDSSSHSSSQFTSSKLSATTPLQPAASHVSSSLTSSRYDLVPPFPTEPHTSPRHRNSCNESSSEDEDISSGKTKILRKISSGSTNDE